MSKKLNKQLQELEQKAKNELFIKQQLQQSKPASQRQAEKFQLPKSDEMLLVKEQEETIEDFNKDLIKLNANEEPVNIPAVYATKQGDIDKELIPVIQDITDVKDEPDFTTRRALMDKLILAGNLIPNTLTADLPANIEYNDMQAQIDSVVNSDINNYRTQQPNANIVLIRNATQIAKDRVNKMFIPIIFNENMRAIMNYRNAWLQNENKKLQQQNQNKLRTYVNRVENQNLYSNIINVNRIPGESDESYAERLDTFRNVPSFKDQQKLQLFQREKSKLRQNLLKITNDINAQQIINIPEITESNILDINKRFPRFEAEIKRNFKGLKLDEFKDYFTDFIGKIENQPMKYETLDMSLGDQLNKTGEDIQEKLDEIEDRLSKTGKPLSPTDPKMWAMDEIEKDAEELKAGLPKRKYDPSQLRNKYRKETLANIAKNKDVLASIGNNSYFLDLLKNPNDNKQLDAFIRKLNPEVLKYRNKLIADGKSKDDAKAEAKIIFGYGIAQRGSEFVEFGKLILDINKLTEQNKLRVLYPNHINVKEIKTTSISQNFEDVIVQLLETNKLNRSLFDTLDKGEQDLLLLLLNRAGLHKFLKDVKSKRDKEIESLSSEKEDEYHMNKLPKSTIDRWDVLKGMIMAGNDNRNLVKEAINIVNTFKSTGHFSESDCNEQIEYLKSLL